MRRNLILPYFVAFMLLFGSVGLKAQSYSFLPTNKMHITVNNSTEKEYFIYVKNTKSTDLTVHWEQLHNGLQRVSGWYYSFCDNVNCYLNIPAENNMNPVAPGDSAFFKLAFGAEDIADTATLSFVMWDADDNSKKDTVVFIVNSLPLSVNDNHIAQDIKLYPNPAQESIKVDMQQSDFSPSYAAIYDVVGKKVKETAWLGKSNLITVSDLDPGVYYLRLTDKNGVQAMKQFYKTR